MARGHAGWVLGVGVAAVAVAALRRPKRRRGRSPGPVRPAVRPPAPDADVEFGGIRFPPPKSGKQWERLQYLAGVAEETTGIGGLYSFLIATARGESGGVPTAMNTKTDAVPAFRLLCREQNYGRRYADNPWLPRTCSWEDALRPRWAHSGGYFQMMPATALATANGRARTHDPARVFDPPFAVAYATDLFVRLARNYGAETFGDVRAGWALPRWANPSSTAAGKQVSLGRFDKNVQRTTGLGVDRHIASRGFSTRDYPGFTALLHTLLAAEGRAQPLAA